MEDAKKEDEEEDIEKESDVDEDEEMEDPDEDDLDFVEEDGSEGSISARTGASSFVEVGKSKKVEEPESGTLDETEEKDDILDINMADWDYQFSPLHYAIVNGHKEVVELLVSDFGADIMQPYAIHFLIYAEYLLSVLQNQGLFRLAGCSSIRLALHSVDCQSSGEGAERNHVEDSPRAWCIFRSGRHEWCLRFPPNHPAGRLGFSQDPLRGRRCFCSRRC